MKERFWLYFVLELLMVAACCMLGFAGQELIAFVTVCLLFACLLMAKLLAQLLKAPQAVPWVVALALAITAFLFNNTLMLPVIAVLLIELTESPALSTWRLLAVAVTVGVLAVILPQQIPALLVTVFGVVSGFSAQKLLRRLEHAQAELEQKDGRIEFLQAQLEHQRGTISAIEQQGRQAERHRLAARIHDKIGHGVTGSILMLEAAELLLDSDPHNARAHIQTATENLRSSVDDIRSDLREERSGFTGEQVSLRRIERELRDFEREHEGIRTRLKVEGSLEDVPQAVWLCIYQNLLETLTNLLKHSNASSFNVLVSQRNRLVYVEFRDNGGDGKATAGLAGGS
ncbi:MAG: histidine kinase, partial [Coriobacteriales bacterium]|nr:histidine kinase [Coriobacteriales bacterium]